MMAEQINLWPSVFDNLLGVSIPNTYFGTVTILITIVTLELLRGK